MPTRRQVSSMLVGGLFCQAFDRASAQGGWPDRPVRLVVPFSAGGGVDIATRVVADKLRDRWNQAVVIENKPGANTLIAAQTVLSAPKDGYTFLVTNAATFYLPAVNSAVKLKPLEEFAPIAELSVDQLVVLCPSSIPAKGLPQLVELAKKNPKSYSFGSYGYGTVAHLLLIEMNKVFGLDMAHVPYKGTAPLVQAMLGGDVQIGVSNYGTAKPFIENGKLRPLAVFGSPRSPFMPEAPTLQEVGVKGFEASQWVGMFAATGTPVDIVKRAALDVSAALKSDGVGKRFAEMFTLPGTKTLDEFGRLVERDAKVQGAMSQAAGIQMGS